MMRTAVSLSGLVLAFVRSIAVVGFGTPIDVANVRTLEEEARTSVPFYPESLLFLSANRLAVAGANRTML